MCQNQLMTKQAALGLLIALCIQKDQDFLFQLEISRKTEDVVQTILQVCWPSVKSEVSSSKTYLMQPILFIYSMGQGRLGNTEWNNVNVQ